MTITRPTRCEYCNRGTSVLFKHHVLGRRFKKVKDDPLNHCYLDIEHHTVSSEFSAHLTPKKFKEWIISKRGEAWWEELNRRARCVN